MKLEALLDSTHQYRADVSWNTSSELTGWGSCLFPPLTFDSYQVRGEKPDLEKPPPRWQIPHPSTLNPQPKTLNPKPQTKILNPELRIINLKP